MEVDYLRLRPSQFRAALRACPVAYLPLGTLEWHGEHMPLGADALQSHGFFLRAAREIGGIVVPPLFLGPDLREGDLIGMDLSPMPEVTYAPQKFDGSAYWVSNDVFATILSSTLAALARAGFKIVVAHGHGPSTNAYIAGSPAWEKEFGLKLVNLRNELEDQDLGLMHDHAAANETSIVMAQSPELVDLAALGDGELMGIAGRDPRTHASPEYGERIQAAQLEWLKGRLAAVLTEIG